MRRPAGHGQRAPFVLLCGGLLCGGLVSLLLLNTVLAQDSYTAARLVRETAQLQRANEKAAREIAQSENPAQLAEKAKARNLHPDPEINVYTDGRTIAENPVGQGR